MTNDDRFYKYRYFTSAAEFRALDGYTERVTATPSDFIEAIGWYSFKKQHQIECSLSGCRTSHGTGLVIRLRDGRITNVGHICGKAFGTGFEAAVKAIAAQQEMKAVLAGLQRYRQEVPRLEMRLERLREGTRGVTSLMKARKTLREMLPSQLARDLTQRAQRNQRTVYRAVLRTDDEIEIAAEQQPSLRGDGLKFKEERAGYLVGLSLFGRDLEELLSKNVDGPLRQFRAGGAMVGIIRMKRLHKAMESVGPALLEAERLLEEGWSFFQEPNFVLMEQMVSTDSDRAKIRGARRVLLASNVQFAA